LSNLSTPSPAITPAYPAAAASSSSSLSVPPPVTPGAPLAGSGPMNPFQSHITPAYAPSSAGAPQPPPTSLPGYPHHRVNYPPQMQQQQQQAQQPGQPSSSPFGARQVRQAADTNVVAVKFATLSRDADALFAGDPTYCKQCNACLSSTSKLLDAKAASSIPATTPPPPTSAAAAAPSASSSSTTDGSPKKEKSARTSETKVESSSSSSSSSTSVKLEEGQRLWICEFCSHQNIVTLEPEEVTIFSSLLSPISLWCLFLIELVYRSRQPNPATMYWRQRLIRRARLVVIPLV
jgi:hypothetical protein